MIKFHRAVAALLFLSFLASPIWSIIPGLVNQSVLKLTITVKDQKGNLLRDAQVTVWKDNFDKVSLYDYQEITDSVGRAYFDVVSKVKAPEVMVKVAKGGLVAETKITLTSPYTSEPITLAPKEREITVVAEDVAGKAVSGARVNVWFNEKWYVSPPDHQIDTNANGEVKVPHPPAGVAKLYVQINRDDLKGEAEIPVSESRAVVKLRNDKTDTADRVGVRIRVGGPDFKGISGAKLIFRFTELRRIEAESNTGPDGFALTGLSAADYNVEILKDGYKPGSTIIRLTTAQVGKVINVPQVTLQKLERPQTAVDVTFRAQDKASKNGVSGAHIVLVERFGQDGRVYDVYTDPNGEASLTVNSSGRYDVEVTQDNFKDHSQFIALAEGRKEVNIPAFLLEEKPKKASEEIAYVTVVSADKGGKPINGAVVKVNQGSMGTDKDGLATIGTAFGLESSVIATASAPGYKTKSQSLKVRRGVNYNNVEARGTVVLEPGDDPAGADSPIRLVVTIRDRNGNPVPGSSVEFLSAGGKLMGEVLTSKEGTSPFNSTDTDEVPIADQRNGILINVRKDGFLQILNRSVPSSLLAPSGTVGEYQIEIDRDWSGLASQIGAIEPRVAKLIADGRAGVVTAGSEMDAATTRFYELFRRYGAIEKGIQVSGTSMSRCQAAAKLNAEIKSIETEATRKETEIVQSISAANAAINSCSVPGNGEAANKSYQNSIRLLGEIGSLDKRATAAANQLQTLKNETAVRREAFAEISKIVTQMRAELAAVESLKTKSDQADAAAKSTAAALAARRNALIVEFGTIRTTYKLDQPQPDMPPELKRRIDAITGQLGAGPGVPAAAAGTPDGKGVAISQMRQIIASAKNLLDDYEQKECDVDLMQPSISRIGAAFTGATIEVGAAANIPNKASSCKNESVCRSLTAEIRAAIASGNLSGADAILAKMNANGCDSSAIKGEIDAANARDAVNLINQSKRNCDFDAAVSLGQRLPASVQNLPSVALALNDARRGQAAGNSIIKLLERAADAPDDRTATTLLTEARALAAPFPCLAEQIKGIGKKPTATAAANPKPRVEDIPEDRPTGGTKPPTVETLPEDRTTAGNVRPGGTRTSPPPTVQTLPEDETTSPVALNQGNNKPVNSSTAATANQPKPQPTPKPQKPKTSVPSDFWWNLGKAIGDGIRGTTSQPGQTTGQQQPQPPPPANGGTTYPPVYNPPPPVTTGGGSNWGDLTGNWWLDHREGDNQLTTSMSLRMTAQNTWQGQAVEGGNMAKCDVEKYFMPGFEGAATLILTGPGTFQMRLTGINSCAVTPTPVDVRWTGTFNASQMNITTMPGKALTTLTRR